MNFVRMHDEVNPLFSLLYPLLIQQIHPRLSNYSFPSSKMRNRRVNELYEKEVTNPLQILRIIEADYNDIIDYTELEIACCLEKHVYILYSDVYRMFEVELGWDEDGKLISSHGKLGLSDFEDPDRLFYSNRGL